MVSIGNLLHRTVVFGSIGFGVYGAVVIGQNFIVKRRRLREYDDQAKAVAAVDAGPSPAGVPAATRPS